MASAIFKKKKNVEPQNVNKRGTQKRLVVTNSYEDGGGYS